MNANKVLDRIRANPTLYAEALSPDEMAQFHWHRHAHRPHSSQVFCISAFGPVRHFPSRDRIISDLLAPLFPSLSATARPIRWKIELEYEQPELLSEFGAQQTTSIDSLLLSSTHVVCVEAKLRTDAGNGFGTCAQFPSRCKGYYGPGSDEAGTAAWCRLESWDGRRSPRTYWAVGKEFFRPDVFMQQTSDEACPFRGSNYQLMRNFLFAASTARMRRLPFFGVLAIVPQNAISAVAGQIDAFKRDVLQERYHPHLGYTTYEAHIANLKATRSAEAVRLAGFLEERLLAIQGSTATGTIA